MYAARSAGGKRKTTTIMRTTQSRLALTAIYYNISLSAVLCCALLSTRLQLCSLPRRQSQLHISYEILGRPAAKTTNPGDCTGDMTDFVLSLCREFLFFYARLKSLTFFSVVLQYYTGHSVMHFLDSRWAIRQSYNDDSILFCFFFP